MEIKDKATALIDCMQKMESFRTLSQALSVSISDARIPSIVWRHTLCIKETPEMEAQNDMFKKMHKECLTLFLKKAKEYEIEIKKLENDAIEIKKFEFIIPDSPTFKASMNVLDDTVEMIKKDMEFVLGNCVIAMNE